MLDTNFTNIEPQSEAKKGRHRGGNCTICLNPNPIFVRPRQFKQLPGALGTLARRAKKKDISKDPLFVQLRRRTGRKRSFRKIRQRLINEAFQAFLDCMDLSTGIATICIEQLAEKLNVVPSRLYRLVSQVLISFDLAYVQANREVIEHDPNFGMPYDKTHNRYFPKILVFTEKFFRVCGADDDLLVKLYNQMEDHLQHNKSGLAKPGEVLSLEEARNRKQQAAFKVAWERRKGAARLQKEKAALAEMESIDDRLNYAATALVLSDPSLQYLAPEDFKNVCWKWLHKRNAAIPIPDRPSSRH